MRYELPDGRVLLDDVSFRVGDGQKVALVGANGSGKSTLLRGMSRLLAPSSGGVLLDGRDLHSLRGKELARRLGKQPVRLHHEVPGFVANRLLGALRDEALRSHRTQVAPDGMFFAVSAELQSQVWPWEDYVLAESRVPIELPEHDLFAGIAG